MGRRWLWGIGLGLVVVGCLPRGCRAPSGEATDAGASEDPDDVDASTPASRRAERAARRAARTREAGALEVRGPAPRIDGATPATSATLANDTVVDAGAYTTGDPAYVEPECDLTDVSAIERAFAPGKTRAAAEGLAVARYPIGLPFLTVQDDAQLKTWFQGAPDTFEGVASRFDAAVHEGSHVWGFRRWNPRSVVYPVRSDLTLETRRLTNFPRSEIVKHHVDPASDTYVKIYLEGASGAQGFNTLLDEYNAYVHSLASRYCTRDLLRPNMRVSAVDGALTMMYYVETYLAIARREHPADHAAILADPGHRRLIISVWDRAELWLRRSAGVRALGIDVARLTERVYDSERLAEIAVVRSGSATLRAK